MNVLDSLFTTELQADGSNSPTTLAEHASRFVADIERQFGPRDRSFTLLGINVVRTPNSPPRLWFPDSGIVPNDAERRSRHVVIRLGPNALSDATRARWQLAHECFHLLDPWNEKVDGRPTNWLEEGLAAWYQNSSVPEAECHEGLYASAEELVRPLMNGLPDAVKRIRTERHLRIGEMAPDVLQAYCPGIDRETSRQLCQPFGNKPEPTRLDTAIEADAASDGSEVGAAAKNEEDHADRTG